MEMTTISDQKISETIPTAASGATLPAGLAALRGHVEGIERARADVAEHDAHAGDRGPRAAVAVLPQVPAMMSA